MSVSCTSSAGAVPRLPFSDSQVLLRNPKPGDLFWRESGFCTSSLGPPPEPPGAGPLADRVQGPEGPQGMHNCSKTKNPKTCFFVPPPPRPPFSPPPAATPPDRPPYPPRPPCPALAHPDPPSHPSSALVNSLFGWPPDPPLHCPLCILAPNSCPLHFIHSHGNLLPNRSKDGGGKWEFRALARNPKRRKVGWMPA